MHTAQLYTYNKALIEFSYQEQTQKPQADRKNNRNKKNANKDRVIITFAECWLYKKFV